MVPLSLLGAVQRAAGRVRRLGAARVDPGRDAAAILSVERAALMAQARELDLAASSLLAASEDRLAFRVAWQDQSAVLKLSLAPSADRRLRREGRVLQALEHRGVVGAPRLLAQGRAGRGRFQVESLIPGRTADAAGEALLGPTAALIAPIHARTATQIMVDRRWLDRHVDRPMAQVHGVLHAALGDRGEAERLASLGRTLHEALDGRLLRVALTHGDFWLQNVLLDARGAPSGIVDWDSAACAPPAIDALHLVLYRRKRTRRGPLGAELARLLSGPAWSAAERAFLELLEPELLGVQLPTLAWLYWLRFVTGNVARHPSLGRNRGWVVANVAQPLRHA